MKHQNINNFIFSFFIFLTACNLSDDLTKQKAAEIYVHLQIFEEQYRYSPDSLSSKINKLYKKYETSRKDYENFLESFGEDEKEWNEFFMLAEKYLAELKKK